MLLALVLAPGAAGQDPHRAKPTASGGREGTVREWSVQGCCRAVGHSLPLLAQRRGGGCTRVLMVQEKSCSPLQANGMAGTAQGLPVRVFTWLDLRNSCRFLAWCLGGPCTAMTSDLWVSVFSSAKGEITGSPLLSPLPQGYMPALQVWMWGVSSVRGSAELHGGA